MAINKNHEFEELDGVKCAIVERNATAGRVEFLKGILEYNKYTVVVAAAAPPKPVAAKPAASTPAPSANTEATTPIAETVPAEPLPPPAPTLFTIGVTDVTFNPINAIFGRLLQTPHGHIVTLAYWQQKEKFSNDEVPYFAKGSSNT